MTITAGVDHATATRLSGALADVFTRADVGDVFTSDLFLDGNPPLWRFQLDSADAFASWLTGYAPHGIPTEVVRVVPTASGFVTELADRVEHDGDVVTSRKIILCEVRDGRISEMTIYCSGDWDEDLRRRHAEEETLLRP
ncbi:MAG TPA: hypothetical protein VNA14_01345 [Mycobacteriales bacterium]|nr:hypothetical protein [Mycobacteriales bacterium]